MKKLALIGICAASAAAICAAGFGIYKVVGSNSKPVDVIPVSQFQGMGMMGDPSLLYANIVSDVSQEVHLTSDKLVNQVYVKEGDKVKVGDKLLSYDTTLLELNLEMYQLDAKTIELKVLGSQTDLEKLKKVTPIPDSEKKNNTGPVTNPLDEDDWDNGDDNEARAVLKQNFVQVSASPMSGSEDGTGSEETPSTQTDASEHDETQSGTDSEPSSENTTEPDTTPDTAPDTTPDTAPGSDMTEQVLPLPSSVNVGISWDHGTNSEKKHPSAVKVSLMNQAAEVQTRVLTAKDGWACTFDNLDPSAAYSIQGEGLEDYTLALKEKPAGTFRLTYHYKEPADSPAAAIKPYEELDYKSDPYKGEGTKKNPYVFFCKDGTTIKGSFINKMLGFDEKGEKQIRKGYYAKLEIREADSLTGGFMKTMGFDGTIRVSHGYKPGTTWLFTSDGIEKQETDIADPKHDLDNGDDGPGDVDWEDQGDFETGYTESELRQAIKEKEQEIRKLGLDKREKDLQVVKAQREFDSSTVTATINGVVKTVGDPAVGEVDGEPFLLITSDEGLYVKGTISELNLETLKKGDVVQGMGTESGMNFSATITEISPYPENSGMYGYGDGNSNSSYYPFTAYIESTEGLRNNEFAQISINSVLGGDNAVYIYKAYMRTENGQSYVYKVDENERLKQQFVKTGKTLYAQYIEITEGLTNEDRIAFPYGKNVKNGAKVKDADDANAMLY